MSEFTQINNTGAKLTHTIHPNHLKKLSLHVSESTQFNNTSVKLTHPIQPTPKSFINYIHHCMCLSLHNLITLPKSFKETLIALVLN